MQPFALALALAAWLVLPARCEDLPKFKFEKSADNGIHVGDQQKAAAILGLQCARIKGRKPSEPCTDAEMAGMLEDRDRALRDVGEKYAHLQACSPRLFTPSRDPDTGGSWLGEICTGAKYEIMTYEGRRTDPTANAGLIRFMRESVLGDCSLYNAAVVFYAGLKDHDLRSRPAPGHESGASLAGVSTLNLALKAQEAVRATYGKDDPYLAMKVLALYGHDNKFNFLSLGDPASSCQLKVLDAIKPNANSALYQNEAIGTPIGSSWVEEYGKLYGECRDAATQRDGQGRETGHWSTERELCGEYTQPQTGYYHLNAAAYLQCACKARGQGMLAATVNDLTEAWQRDVYMGKIAEYKVNAIAKVIERALAQGHTPATRLLSFGFPAEVAKGMKPGAVDGLPWDKWCADTGRFQAGTCGPEHIGFAKAAMKLFVFEVNYRLHLHHLGILAGNSYCGSGATLAHTRCP